jgi:hypothetical protein
VTLSCRVTLTFVTVAVKGPRFWHCGMPAQGSGAACTDAPSAAASKSSAMRAAARIER